MAQRVERARPAASARTGARRRARRKSSGGLLVAMTLVTAAYFVPRGISWNADTHLFLTASIVDRGSLNIDPFASHTGDLAMVNGHYYTDKAPGLSLLAVPFYLLLKLTLLGGQPLASVYALPEPQRVDFLVRYLLAIICAGIPTAIVTLLLYRFLPRLGASERWSAGLALTYALGTIARPFAGQLFSHQLAAALLFGAFVLLYRVRHGGLSPRFTLLAGALLGCAVITEYPTALIAACLTVYALLPARTAQQGSRPSPPPRLPTVTSASSAATPRSSVISMISVVKSRLSARQRTSALLLAAGAAPLLAVGAVYNTLAFGGPLSTGYAHLAGPQEFRAGQAQGLFGITVPHLDAIWSTTIGPERGIFLLSPVLLLAIPGFAALRHLPAWRAERRLWLAIVAVYALFTVSYYMWDGGYSMGPRDFLPALPFLMLPIAVLVRSEADVRWRRAALVLAVLSIGVVELATATGPLVDSVFPSPLIDKYLPRLLAGTLDNNWGMLFGLPGLFQLLPLALILALLYRAHWRRTGKHATLSAGEVSAIASG